MTLTALAVLILLALLLVLLSRRRGAAGVLLLALVLTAALGCGPLTRWMLTDLQEPYAASVTDASWTGRNVILLLGAGTVRVPEQAQPEPPLFAYGRIAQAAALYRQCKAAGHDCKLLVSGGNPQHHAAAEAEVYGAQLRRMGVPDADLLIESRSESTWQNAQFTRPMLQAYGAQRIWLVTSGVHMRRSLQYFAHFGIVPLPVRGDYLHAVYSWLPSAWNFAMADVALHEYLGIARYRVYAALGWNAPALPPLAPAP
jgi:uncharacterized SAM-binding protein YcdF (DUF218 family)